MAGELTTLDNVKAWLGVTNTDSDELLSRLIAAASQFIQTWAGRSFAVQDYSERRDGNGGRQMLFADFPVLSVSRVAVNRREIPPIVEAGDNGYSFTPSKLTLDGFVFNRGELNVLLEYKAGYETVPADVEQACIEMIALRFKERDRIGFQSKSLAGETVTFFIKDMTDSAQSILNGYRKVAPL